MTWLCDRHHGVGGDGVLLLGPPGERGFVARLRIFNPDGSEAELSGNGAREAMLYLRRRGWTDSDVFSVQTIAGEVRARVTGDGRARSTSAAPRSGRPARSTWPGSPMLPAHRHRQPADPDPRRGSRRAGPGAVGAPVEHDPRFPNRTNVSFWRELAPDRVRARIWERGVGETMSSGTGACGAAVAHVLRGGDSPVTVVLDGGELVVGVEEDLHVELTGWARPVFRGTIDPEARA